jgi:hypothetical protein
MRSPVRREEGDQVVAWRRKPATAELVNWKAREGDGIHSEVVLYLIVHL